MSTISVPITDFSTQKRANTLKQKAWLLLIMLILPMTVVAVPGLIVSHFFGQHPTFSKIHKKSNAALENEQMEGLRHQLESISARELPDDFKLRTSNDLSSNAELSNDNHTTQSPNNFFTDTVK